MTGTRKRTSRGRGVMANGRSKESKRYVALRFFLMESDAFKALSPFDVRVLVELYALFNGNNNGYLYLSCRAAANRCNMGKNTAGKCFHRLQELGFIRRRADEPEDYHLREANHWILTEFDFRGRPATKDFLSWRQDKNSNTRPSSDTRRPRSDTNLNGSSSEPASPSRIRDKNSEILVSTVSD